MATEKQLNFILRYCPQINSINGILFRYLGEQKKTGYTTKQRILKAVSAFWMPFAAEWVKKDECEQRNIALSSIYQLESHIQYIREQFDIPQPQIAYVPTENSDLVQEESEVELSPEEEADSSIQDDEFGGMF